MRLNRACALALLGLLAACGRSPEKTATPTNETIVAPGAEANVGEAPNAAQKASAAEAPLDALAGVKVGMTMADLRKAGFDAVKDNGPDPDNRCGYARIASLKDLFFMLDGDTVVRIEVDTPGHPTLGGVAVGMAQGEAMSRLGDRAKVTPAPNATSGSRDLIVHDAKSPLGLIVETDGRKVVSYRIGRWTFVQQAERCM